MAVRHFTEKLVTDQSLSCHLIEYNLYKVFLSICDDKRITERIPAQESSRIAFSSRGLISTGFRWLALMLSRYSFSTNIFVSTWRTLVMVVSLHVATQSSCSCNRMKNNALNCDVGDIMEFTKNETAGSSVLQEDTDAATLQMNFQKRGTV